MKATAMTELHAAFSESFEALGRDAGQDRNVVVASWPSVPVEVIRTAGFSPVFAVSSARETPAADQVLEAGVFPNRIRQLLEAALTGRLAHVAAIVVPRTSEVDYKAFLYLEELRRRGRLASLPPVLLFDLLQSRGPDIATYDAGRVRDLLARLGALSGHPVSADALSAQIASSNAARGAARRLTALRGNPARVAGTEMLPLLGARWSLPPERYTVLADKALQMLATRAPLAGPRCLLAGAPVDSVALHAAIESLQGTVVDEITPYGTDGAAGVVDAAADPFAALAAWYGTHSITARTPVATLIRRFEDSLGGIDAAFIVLPADDARFGWDYPRMRQLLQRRGIDHAVISGDPVADREPIGAVLSRSPRMQASRHG
jgi:hypothetical protein